MAKDEPVTDTPTPASPDAAPDTSEGASVDNTKVRPGGTEVQLLDETLDGEVTFTVPGVEAKTFNVAKGKVSVSEQERDWLLRKGLAATPAAE